MADELDQRIRVHVRHPWDVVPIRLIEAGTDLSPDARLTLIYPLDRARRPAWAIYVRQVRHAIGLRAWRWTRARKKLESRGYFWAESGHSAHASWTWTHHLNGAPTASGTARQNTVKCNVLRGLTAPMPTPCRSAAGGPAAHRRPSLGGWRWRRRQRAFVSSGCSAVVRINP